MTPALQSPPSPQRRRAWWAAGLLGVLLIPAVQIYRAEPTVADGGPETVQRRPPNPRDTMPARAEPAASLAEAWHEQPPRTGVDASSFYKNAFVLYAALTDDEKKMFRQPLEELDPDTAATLFEKIHSILELLRQGAEADYCEWGLGEISYDTPLPHLSKARELGQLAQWSAGYRFPTDPQGAIADLRAQARLGDHLADTLIGWLVQMSLESGGNKVLRQNAGALDEAGAGQAQALIQSSTIEQNVARAFAAEAAFVDTMAKKLAAQTPTERMKFLQITGGTSDEPAQQALLEMLQDEHARAAEFQYLRQIEQQMTEAILWPDGQFHAWWQNVESNLPAHPLAAITLPTLVGIRSRLQRTQVERAMLSAGLALLQSGPEQLGQFCDPVTGATFGYVEKPDGFELRSTFKNKGEAMTMSFGPRR